MKTGYSFDKEIERRGTGSLKYDCAAMRGGRDDLLPMWVADMDFVLPEEILERIRQRTDHGVFGYTEPDSAYYDTLENWFRTRYGWEIERDWNTVTPGVVYALSCAIRAYTKEGDAVLIQEPVYYPFREMIELNGRKCVVSPLVNRDGRYEMDFEDMERKLAEENVKLFILCSPHNPVSRVWERDELEKAGRLCLNHGAVVVADEIHCDFIYKGYSFTPYGSLDEELVRNAVICTSASKTFNLAGLQVANILIPDRKLRNRFRHMNAASGYSQANVMGLTATKAAYDLGGPWLDDLIEYLEGTIDEMDAFTKEHLPGVKMIRPEGTYLVWMDFSGVTQSEEELHRIIRDGAHLWLDDGSIFGAGSELFERFNIACPRSTVRQAMTQLEAALLQR
ncbi:MAG: pyridoxal phosphate-dependent aminotransferase [Lachnospiraceae bacterium]|nr:pyridoxal phosphate-dependent aminotransferase [Lachnospiraceae bacterium]